jgi:hypothetical protein
MALRTRTRPARLRGRLAVVKSVADAIDKFADSLQTLRDSLAQLPATKGRIKRLRILAHRARFEASAIRAMGARYPHTERYRDMALGKTRGSVRAGELAARAKRLDSALSAINSDNQHPVSIYAADFLFLTQHAQAAQESGFTILADGAGLSFNGRAVVPYKESRA